MPSPGETLLKNMNDNPPESEDAGQVEQPKPRRRRKKREDVEEEPVAAAEVQEPEVSEPEPASEADDVSAGAAEEDTQPEWLKRLESEAGFQNVGDPNEAGIRAVEQLVRQQRELEEYQRKLRDAEYRQVAAAKQPEPSPSAEPQRKPWQAPVDYPKSAERYLTKNEDGATEWKSDTPAEVRAKAESWLAWQSDIADTLLNRPDVFFNEILPAFIDEHAKKVIEPFYEQKTAQQREQDFFAQFQQDNADWLFMKDPQTGQPDYRSLSNAGRLLDERISHHIERGYSPEEATEYAQYDVQRQTGQSPWVKQQQVQQPSPQQVRDESRRKTLRKPLGGAETVPQRTGSFTEPEEGRPQNGNISAGQSLLNRARREGVKLPFEVVT